MNINKKNVIILAVATLPCLLYTSSPQIEHLLNS